MPLIKKQKPLSILPERLAELAEFRYRLRRFLGFSESAADRVGISVQQYQLLQVIASVRQGHSSSITYVAERMLLRHNSAVELVDRAERSGLVKRVADEADHRRSLVEITDRGSRILIALVEEHLREIERDGPDLLYALQKLIDSRHAGKRNGTR
jgi:DNA-binding MarR family transcriptional regulator